MVDTFRGQVGCLLDCAMDAFGESITYCPISGGRIEISAVYDDQFEQVDAETEQLISSNQPTLGIKLADLGNIEPTKGDKVFRKNGEKFRVIESKEDGHGGSLLIMHIMEAACK